jgi:hypothetical protein
MAADLAPAAGRSTPTWVWVAVSVAGVVVLIVVIVALGAGGRRKVKERICPNPGCAQVWLEGWTQCGFCGTAAMPALSFRSGPLRGMAYPLAEEITTLGSLDGNSIVLQDPAVSRKHAGIRRDVQGWELADLGSLNGVYVNGERVAKHRLREGDVVRVGQSEAVFELPAG